MKDYDPRFTDHPFPKRNREYPLRKLLIISVLWWAAIFFADVVSDALMPPGIEIETGDCAQVKC